MERPLPVRRRAFDLEPNAREPWLEQLAVPRRRRWDADWWIAVADLNGDGHNEVIAAAGGAFVVFPGGSDGTFGSAIRYPVPQGATSLVAADVDGDRAPELVMAGTRGGQGGVRISGPPGRRRAPCVLRAPRRPS